MSILHRLSLSIVLLPMLAGCGYFRQPGLTIEFANHSADTMRNLEIDFPGGSFGVADLPPGGRGSRWIKVTGNGALKADYFDSAGEHRLDAINLARGDSGILEIVFQTGGQLSVIDHRQHR